MVQNRQTCKTETGTSGNTHRNCTCHFC